MNGFDLASEAAFSDYVDGLVEVIGHADRAEPLGDYCRGLMLSVARKSVEPLAAVTAPARMSAKEGGGTLHRQNHTELIDRKN